jgi:Tol biopolymer transport system component
MYIRVPSDVSPDGKLVAYFNIGERQEDIFLAAPDGTMRRVTDDAARDRGPMFTPDGRSVVFYSNRSGNWGVWTVNVDGSNLRKLTEPPVGTIYPVVSPNGDALVFSGATATGGVMMLPLPAAPDATPSLLPNTTADGKLFVPTTWSPDGKRLAGYMVRVTGRNAGVGVYDLAAQRTTIVSDDLVDATRWLADSRRLIYFTNRSELTLFDTASKTRTVLDVRLPGPSTNDVFAISPDNKTIYYGAARSEADIWIVERK